MARHSQASGSDRVAGAPVAWRSRRLGPLGWLSMLTVVALVLLLALEL